MAKNQKPTGDLARQILKARLQFPRTAIKGTGTNRHSGIVVEDPLFGDRLRSAGIKQDETGCEVGFTQYVFLNSKATPSPSSAQWGSLVKGDSKSIREKHDTSSQYYCHLQGALPLIMIHGHPSGQLGLSREDCLMAGQVLREAQKLLVGHPTSLYRPIFGTFAVDECGISVLLVQRIHPNQFMHFEEIQSSYGPEAWLRSPYFNAATFFLPKDGSSIEIISDTGLQPPLQ